LIKTFIKPMFLGGRPSIIGKYPVLRTLVKD